MPSDAGHLQLVEYNKESIPYVNWMLEDLFCQYGINIPWFMLDFDFPDYSERPDWVSGYNFNLDWGEWGYWLPWFNELLGIIFDEAHLPRWQMPDMAEWNWPEFNFYIEILYDNIQTHYVYNQSGTFTKDEVVEGETSGITGWYKWKDGDGYIHIANKQDASGESVSDFEDEKVVGADSGAYFYTYLPTEPVYVYHSGTSAPFVRKYGNRINSWVLAWDEYDNDPNWTGGPVSGSDTIRWGAYDPYTVFDPIVTVGGQHIILQFDTSDTISTPATITLRLDVEEIVSEIGTPTLKLYKITEEPLPDTPEFWTTYWNYSVEENHIIDQEIDATGNYDIPLTESDINIGGTTRILIKLASTDVSQPIPPDTSTTEYNSALFDSPFTENIWLKFTY